MNRSQHSYTPHSAFTLARTAALHRHPGFPATGSEMAFAFVSAAPFRGTLRAYDELPALSTPASVPPNRFEEPLGEVNQEKAAP